MKQTNIRWYETSSSHTRTWVSVLIFCSCVQAHSTHQNSFFRKYPGDCSLSFGLGHHSWDRVLLSCFIGVYAHLQANSSWQINRNYFQRYKYEGYVCVEISNQMIGSHFMFLLNNLEQVFELNDVCNHILISEEMMLNQVTWVLCFYWLPSLNGCTFFYDRS